MAKTGKIFLVGLVAAAAGAIGGLLLAPKSGKETRDDLKKLAESLKKQVKTGVQETEAKVIEVFGEATKAATDKYTEIRTAVVDKIVALKTAGNEIDKDKYGLIVEKVVNDFKDDLVASKTSVVKMATQLKKDWEKIKKVLV
ncbi:MAG: YtxH domain-containing protein [Candidatus Shapirobacteria bacterium]